MERIIEAIQPVAHRKTFSKRRVLFYQGEVPKSAYILNKGIVKAYSINSSGNEQIAAFYSKGGMFPSTWIFNKSSTAIYYYEALTDCEVWIVEKEALRQKILTNPTLLRVALEYILDYYTSTLLRITALEQSRASEKIMFTLYYLTYRHSKEIKPGKFAIEIKLTQNAIADMVGLTRETTTSELNKLRKAGVISYSSGELIVDKTGLEKLMGEDSFSSLMD